MREAGCYQVNGTALVAWSEGLPVPAGSQLVVLATEHEAVCEALHQRLGELEAKCAYPEHVLSELVGKRLFESRASNYIESSFTCDDYPDLGTITVTIRREGGKTPHELRTAAEAEAERLREDLIAVHERLAAAMERRNAATLENEELRKIVRQAATAVRAMLDNVGFRTGEDRQALNRISELLAGGTHA